MPFNVTSKELVFKFDNAKMAEHFKIWLCEQGEQDYWIWMEYREQEEEGIITAYDFDYWKGNTIIAAYGREQDGKNPQ